MADSQGPILLVEDTPSLSQVYASLLKKAGYAVDCAFTAGEALGRYDRAAHRVVLLDLMLPDGDGIDVLRHIRAVEPAAKAIVITSNGSINRAVDAMRAGAFDFLVKPFDENRFLKSIESALSGSVAPPGMVIDDLCDAVSFHGFVGASPAMRAIYEIVRDVGRSSATVFITGESGTGKEVCAQAIHQLSPRRDRPFVPLNCGAIPRDLLESEVFGHLKGSFTGAISDKPGAAAVADGGTLFLDEICEMDIDLQTKLLRFLQTSTIQPVGAAAPRKVDVRIVCATNRDPQAEVDAGRFRSDLFYRLYVVPIHLPPLRQRGEDVIQIAEALLAQFAREEGKSFERLSTEVVRAFRAYGWPGNVRELQNVLRNVAVLRDGREVTLSMLPPRIAAAMGQPGPQAPPVPSPPVDPADLRGRLRPFVGSPLDLLEREFIEATIEACDGSIPRAARMLEVSPSTLYRKREGWMKAVR
jgi:two-component system, repressor protein LuxO